MKDHVRLTAHINRCVGTVSSTNEPWSRSHISQFARARRPTAER